MCGERGIGFGDLAVQATKILGLQRIEVHFFATSFKSSRSLQRA